MKSIKIKRFKLKRLNNKKVVKQFTLRLFLFLFFMESNDWHMGMITQFFCHTRREQFV